MTNDGNPESSHMSPTNPDQLQVVSDDELISRGLDRVLRKRERVIELSSDRSCGMLRLTGQADSPWVGWNAERSARGTIRVPAGMDLALTIDASKVTDLSGLRAIKAGDVQHISLRGDWLHMDDWQLSYLLNLVLRDPDITLDLSVSLRSIPAHSIGYLNVLVERAQHVYLEDVTDDTLANIRLFSHPRSLSFDWFNKVTDEGVKHLAGLTSLEVLGLNNTKITDAGLLFLLDLNSLHTLSLRQSPVGDQGMFVLGKLLSLRRLDLLETRITDVGLRRLSGVLPSLTWLGLWSTGVTDAGMPCLATAVRLVEALVLGNLSITDEGLRHLHGLHGLTNLYLSNTRITDSGLGFLRELTALETLSLSQTAITDNSVETLTRFRRLTKLNLNGSQVTPRGLKSLKAALPTCEISSS